MVSTHSQLWGHPGGLRLIADLKNGHNVVTIGCKFLCRDASMGFDSPAPFVIINCSSIGYGDDKGWVICLYPPPLSYIAECHLITWSLLE